MLTIKNKIMFEIQCNGDTPNTLPLYFICQPSDPFSTKTFDMYQRNNRNKLNYTIFS